jgi:signal transduction histidine kinase
MPKGSILVVDDEPDVLELCLRVLNQAGYQTQGADTGREAISYSRERKFNLLLTDINMPDITGLDVAQAVKEIDPDITCVTMTGFGTMDLAIEALKLGIDEFVVKPFSPDELTVTVSKALEKQRLRRENARLQALIPLFELNKTLMTTIDMTRVLQQVVDIAREATGADRASLSLYERGDSQAQPANWACSPAHPGSGEQMRVDQAVAQYVSKSKVPLILAQGERIGELPLELGPAARSTLVANPLLVQERLIGVLILSKQGVHRPFSPSDVELLSVLSGQAAIAIENARLFEEIQRAYQELKELDRLKSEFVNIAAHELRTPLAILLGYAGIMIEETVGETKERLGIVMRNALRLRSIIDEMLDLRRLETGEARLRVETFSLMEDIYSVIEDLAPLTADKKHSIEVDIAPRIDQVRTDHRRFDMVLTNLLSNAIKFTEPQGQIVVRVRKVEGELQVSVIDNGIGIPPEEQQRIFTRFYQIEDSLTRQHGGMGIGLAIAKGMVEVCGGRIAVQSIVGQGSTFTFTIPQQP